MRGQVGSDGGWGDWIGAEVSTTRPRPVIDDVAAPPEPPRAPTLGELLRAERERQGLGLDQIEAVTRIRATQLRAIEDDRLDALPAEAYARGFVRTYADQLAMDADATVHLFNEQWSRLNTFRPEQYPPLHPPVAAAGDAPRPLAAISMVLALLLLIGSATVFVLREDHGSGHTAQRPPLSHAPSRATSPSPGTTRPPPAPSTPKSVRMTVTAAAGACWLEARLGSSTGRLLVERTLAPGEAVRLRGRRIWLRLGNPTNVRLRLNGRSLKLAPTADPINLLVTPHGAKAA